MKRNLKINLSHGRQFYIKNPNFNWNEHKLFNFVDKVYLINLKRRIDRLKAMEFKLNKLGIKYEIIEACDGYSDEYKDYWNVYNNYAIEHKLKDFYGNIRPVITSPGAIGLIFTFIKLFSIISKNVEQNILILEDDVCFHKHIKKFHINNNIDYDIIYIGHNTINKNNLLKRGFYKFENLHNAIWVYGTFAMIMNKKYAIELSKLTINDFFNENATIDFYLNKVLYKNKKNVYIHHPPLIIPEVRESDNMASRDLNEFCEKREITLNDYDYYNLSYEYSNIYKQLKYNTTKNVKLPFNAINFTIFIDNINIIESVINQHYYFWNAIIYTINNIDHILNNYKNKFTIVNSPTLFYNILQNTTGQIIFMKTTFKNNNELYELSNKLTENQYYEFSNQYIIKSLSNTINTFNSFKNNNFVFIIPSFNNKKYIKHNLESIFSQNYNNWRLIYINDCSTDNTEKQYYELVNNSKYKNKCIYIKNNIRRGQAYSRHIAYSSCDNNDICILLDGDDFLLNENVLTFLNYFYNSNNIECTYRNFKYLINNKITNGYKVDEYSDEVIKNKSYRHDLWRGGHLRTCKAKLIKQIDIRDLLDDLGNFIFCCTDIAETYCYLELSNGKHKIMSDDLMVYNRDNSEQTTNSYYNVSKNDNLKLYYELIKNKIVNRQIYKLHKQVNKTCCVIDSESIDYYILINKYFNELNNVDLLFIPIRYINIYENVLYKYEQIIMLNEYTNISLISLDKYNNVFNGYNNLQIQKPNNNKILITCLISCYNCEKTIIETLQSLENQTNKNFEVILINDCSFDNTEKIITSYLSKTKLSCVYYNNIKNLSYPATMHKGITLSNTNYIAVIDSDDTIKPETIEIFINTIQTNDVSNVGLIYSNYYYCDDKLNITSKGISKKIKPNLTNLEQDCVSHLRCISKYHYYKTHGVDTELYKLGAEDKDIYFKLEEISDLFFIDQELYYYRLNSQRMSKKGDTCLKNFVIAKAKAKERRQVFNILNNFYKSNEIKQFFYTHFKIK